MVIWVSIIAAVFLPYLMTRACDPNNVNRDFFMMGACAASGLGFYCFAQPVPHGAHAKQEAHRTALREAEITSVPGHGI